MQELHAALATIPPGVRSDATAEQHVIDLLADFPPDRAWWIARTVAKWAAFYAREHPQLNGNTARSKRPDQERAPADSALV
jgi:hypothetical protein